MKKILLSSILFCAFCQFGFTQLELGDCTEIFISEYVEGSNKNRVLEIYNPTQDVVDLSNYSIKIFTAGPNNPNVLPMMGFLPPKEVHVCGHPQADPTGILPKCDVTSSQIKFDGNDAVGLYKNDTLIDLIGVIGVDPGNSGWMVGTGFTKNNTLVRGYDVRGPTPYWNISQLQWEVFPNDDTLQLGKHETICALGIAWFTELQVQNVDEDDVWLNLIVFVNNPDSSGIVLEIGHPNVWNCLDPMNYATFGQDFDYTTPYGLPIMYQVPGLANGNITIPIHILEDFVAEPDDEAICFQLYPGLGYTVPQDEEFKYKHSLIILDDGDVTDIQELTEEKIKVYPTITDGIITVDRIPDDVEYRLAVYDIFGKEVYRQELKKGTTSEVLNVGNFSSGMYILSLEGKGWTIARKFIRN